MAQDPGALAVLVRRLGCAHRAPSPDRLAAVAQPMGLSLAWAAAAFAQTSAQSAHHRWVTGLCLPGAGSKTPLVSFSSPARGDPVAQAALRDRRGDRRTQAGDEARVADPRSAHGSATPSAAAGTGPGVGDYRVGGGGGGEVTAAYWECGQCLLTLDHQCHGTLLPGLRAVLQNPQ